MKPTILGKILLTLAVAAAILGTIGVLAHRTIGRLIEDNHWVARSSEVLLELEGAEAAVLAAESAQRGYLITGRGELLDWYGRAVAAARGHLAELRRLTADNGGQERRLDRAAAAAAARIEDLEETLAAARAGGLEAGRRRVGDGPGLGRMAELGAAVADLERAERRLRQARIGETRRSYRVAMAAFGLMAMGILLALAAAYAMARRELNERRRVSEELRASRERFELAVKGSRDGLWDWDVRTDKVYFSPQWKAQLGYRDDEVESRFAEWESRLHPDDHDRAMATVRAYLEGRIPVYDLEHRLRHRDGTYRWILARGVAQRDEGGAPYRMAGSHTDITARKQAEGRLAEQNRLLEEIAASEREAHEALKQAQVRMVQSEKLASLGQMVAGVAHEINNPLAYVLTNLAVMRRDVQGVARLLGLYAEADGLVADRAPELSRRIREHSEAIDLPYTLENLGALLERSRDGLKRIQGIVANLRDFARLDEGELKEADLNAGIASTAEILRAHAQRRGVALDLELGALPAVLCHPGKINQVVLNLVSNAIDACGEGGRVTVRTRAAEGGVELRVEDTGSGIAPELLPRIFDPFFTTKPIGQGTGLGLSITYGIVQEHGGRIEVDSTPGRGSRFTVTLPLRPPRAA